MAENPSATTRVRDEAVAGASGTGYLAVFAAVAKNADATPRVISSSKGLLEQHEYSPGASYVATHISETRKGVLFCGLPIVTAGVVGRVNASGVSGTSVISISAGPDGALEETQGIFRVSRGGTVGTHQIAGELSLDNGETFKPIRLGTALSYTVPHVGVTLNFGAGSLLKGDTITWTTTAPRWDAAGLTAARQKLAAQKKLVRSILVIGDLENSTDAGDVVGEANTYETSHKRFTYARAQVRDRLPLAALSKQAHRMTGTPTLTFAEVGGTGDTITRSAGSFIADGLAVGDIITVAGSTSNNVTGPIASLSATVITLGTTDLENEGPVGGCSIVAYESLTFAAGPKTVTRNRGSWLADGFRVGDVVTIDGTSSNNVTGPITALTPTAMTLGDSTIANEVIGANAVTVTTGETKTAWVSAMDAAFASIDAQKRIDLGLGRRRKKCPITGYRFRRPVQWAASLREYTLRDIHIATWRKGDGPLDGWDSEDTEEYDEEVDGGALAARFTCFKSWPNGPDGAFIAQSLTRAGDDSILSMTHNLAVVNLACTTAQTATENAVGESLILNDDGTGSDESLGLIEGRVNKALQIALLQSNSSEGPRASSAVWTARRDDILNVPNARLHGVLALNLRGTIVHVDTDVVVQSGGG